MSNVTVVVAAFGALLTLIGVAAGIAAYFRKGLGEAIVDRYKEIHQADELRISQLEDDNVKLVTRVTVLERENETLKDLAIGRDILIQISGMIAAVQTNTIDIKRLVER